jgi:uncharacterized protein (DUF1697 family)
MNKYVSLLRGINVGGQKKLAMEILRRIYKEAGLSHVQTYVQSGNVVFECKSTAPTALKEQLEAAIEAACGYQVPVFVRQAADLEHLLKHNPFYNHRHEDPRWLHVTFLYETPPAAAWNKVVAPAGIVDEFARDESAIYLFCPNGYGKTKLSNNFFERKLGTLTTTRNWNTVNALYTLSSNY